MRVALLAVRGAVVLADRGGVGPRLRGLRRAPAAGGGPAGQVPQAARAARAVTAAQVSMTMLMPCRNAVPGRGPQGGAA